MARSAESFVVESDFRACLAVSYSADWVHSAVMRKSVGISNKSNSSLERGPTKSSNSDLMVTAGRVGCLISISAGEDL